MTAVLAVDRSAAVPGLSWATVCEAPPFPAPPSGPADSTDCRRRLTRAGGHRVRVLMRRQVRIWWLVMSRLKASAGVSVGGVAVKNSPARRPDPIVSRRNPKD